MNDEPCVRCGAAVMHGEDHEKTCPVIAIRYDNGFPVKVYKPGIAYGADIQGTLRRPAGRPEQLIRVNDIEEAPGSADKIIAEVAETAWARPTPRVGQVWGSAVVARRGGNRTKGTYRGKKRQDDVESLMSTLMKAVTE